MHKIYSFFLEYDYAAAAEKLRKQVNDFAKLKYDNMERSLYAYKVITAGERKEIKSKVGGDQMDYLIVDIIIPSLEQKFSKKYKGFLKAMEDSEDIDLQKTAEMLGTYVATYVNFCCRCIHTLHTYIINIIT